MGAGFTTLVCMLAVQLLVAPADGFGKISTRKDTVPVSGIQGTMRTAVGKCPKGSRVISGGFRIGGPSVGLAPFESRRVGRRAWHVSAIQSTATTGNPAGKLTAYAYCDRNAATASVVSQSTSLQNNSDSAQAKCPKGRKAVAGGFNVQTDSDFIHAASISTSQRSSARVWQVVGHGQGDMSTKMTAFAYCAKAAGHLRTRTSHAEPVSQGNSGTATTPSCPASGARAGGFSYSQPLSEYVVYESRRKGHGWRASARELLPALDTTIQAFAYCP